MKDNKDCRILQFTGHWKLVGKKELLSQQVPFPTTNNKWNGSQHWCCGRYNEVSHDYFFLVDWSLQKYLFMFSKKFDFMMGNLKGYPHPHKIAQASELRYESSTHTSKELSSPIFQSRSMSEWVFEASLSPDQISTFQMCRIDNTSEWTVNSTFEREVLQLQRWKSFWSSSLC